MSELDRKLAGSWKCYERSGTMTGILTLNLDGTFSFRFSDDDSAVLRMITNITMDKMTGTWDAHESEGGDIYLRPHHINQPILSVLGPGKKIADRISETWNRIWSSMNLPFLRMDIASISADTIIFKKQHEEFGQRWER